jgi:polyribonucleotide nucleotidyltransferase
MESNGSTSMASVCSGSMALLDAGVPLARPVAGISVRPGHRVRRRRRAEGYKTLLDIIGSEDFFGDMDFKLCGTTEGVTGYQLDLKLPGIPLSCWKKPSASPSPPPSPRGHGAAIAAPAELSPYAPRIETPKSRRIASANSSAPAARTSRHPGRNRRRVNIEDDGTVHIYSTSQPGLDARPQENPQHVRGNRDRHHLHRPRGQHHQLRRVHGSPARQATASSTSRNWPTSASPMSRTSSASATSSPPSASAWMKKAA